MTERQHHPIGPSGIYLADLCPGSRRMATAARRMTPEPEPDSDDVAVVGSRCHDCVASCIEGEPYSLDDDTEQRWVNRCLKWLSDTIMLPEREVAMRAVEAPVVLKGRPNETINWGWIDFAVKFRDPELPLYLVDWKFYRSQIKARAITLQLGNYAAPFLASGATKKVVAIAYNPIEQWEYRAEFNTDDLRRIQSKVRKTIQGTEAPSAPLHPGLDQCSICRGRSVCRAAQSMALEINKVTELPAVPTEKEIKATVDLMTDEQILTELTPAKFAFLLGEEIIKRARKLLIGGAEHPEYEMGSRKGNPEIPSVEAAARALVYDGGMTWPQFWNSVKASKGKLENGYVAALQDRNPDVTKKAAKELFEERMDGVIRRGPDQHVLRRKKVPTKEVSA